MGFASFVLKQCYGTSTPLTETDTSKHPNFVTSNAYESDPATHPIPVPQVAGQFAYSFEQHLRFVCTAAPDNSCDNFVVWGPNVQPDYPNNKVTIYWGVTGTETVPVATASTIATTTQHNNYYESGVALSLPVDNSAGAIESIGDKTEWLVAQLKVAFGAQKGNLPTIVFYVEWDES